MVTRQTGGVLVEQHEWSSADDGCRAPSAVGGAGRMATATALQVLLLVLGGAAANGARGHRAAEGTSGGPLRHLSVPLAARLGRGSSKMS